MQRVFESATFVQVGEREPVRVVVTESSDAVVVMWHVLPGQRIAPHVHPAGQDTWTVLAGRADYIVDAQGTALPLQAGQIAVARAGQVHGAINRGDLPFQFVSVVAPQEAGYALLDDYPSR